MIKPEIAIITENSLESFGLKSIIKEMMPGADIETFKTTESLYSTDYRKFYHFFVSTKNLLTNAAFFLENLPKTIVLVHGEESGHFPKKFHTLDLYVGENELVKNILKLAETAHNVKRPLVVQNAKKTKPSPHLTNREIQVLRLVVSGLINKEIAKDLDVGLSTIITHRKNITKKLNIKSVSGLTIYAVSHGIIKAEEI